MVPSIGLRVACCWARRGCGDGGNIDRRSSVFAKRATARPQRETGFGNVTHRIYSERHTSQGSINNLSTESVDPGKSALRRPLLTHICVSLNPQRVPSYPLGFRRDLGFHTPSRGRCDPPFPSQKGVKSVAPPGASWASSQQTALLLLSSGRGCREPRGLMLL